MHERTWMAGKKRRAFQKARNARQYTKTASGSVALPETEPSLPSAALPVGRAGHQFRVARPAASSRHGIERKRE
jgi:hypothetical protein